MPWFPDSHDFQPATFDLVMISFALHECGWPAAVDMLDEVYRVLKPGGQLLIVDYADLKHVRGHVRLAISAIEFLAGRHHFSNFRNYHRKGGLRALIDPHRFSLLTSRKRVAGSIEIQEFKPLKDKTLNGSLCLRPPDRSVVYNLSKIGFD
jgi:demethylmenaquinone methyltransferase/2-methoxy-6-polyprenyl-1,4-benzoquinol methylase